RTVRRARVELELGCDVIPAAAKADPAAADAEAILVEGCAALKELIFRELVVLVLRLQVAGQPEAARRERHSLARRDRERLTCLRSDADRLGSWGFALRRSSLVRLELVDARPQCSELIDLRSQRGDLVDEVVARRERRGGVLGKRASSGELLLGRRRRLRGDLDLEVRLFFETRLRERGQGNEESEESDARRA